MGVRKFKITHTQDDYWDDTVDAKIEIVGGASKSRDAGIMAKFTEKLANLLGRIKERHIGTHDVGIGHHRHEDGSIHQNHS